MNPAEALSLLGAKAGVAEPSGHSIGALNGMDVAMAMAGLDEYTCDLLRVKYATPHDWAVMDRLSRAWATEVQEIAEQEGWAYRRGIEHFVQAMLTEGVGTRVCERCEGRGFRIEEANRIGCSVCEGLGRSHWSMRRRARASRIDWKSFHMRWASRYQKMLARLCMREAVGLEHVRKKLRR